MSEWRHQEGGEDRFQRFIHWCGVSSTLVLSAAASVVAAASASLVVFSKSPQGTMSSAEAVETKPLSDAKAAVGRNLFILEAPEDKALFAERLPAGPAISTACGTA